MSEHKGQNYLHGAAILAGGVIIMKILGFIYKIPLGNLLTDEGYAHFNVAYNIYNLLLTLSTAGLPVALSRMISAANITNRPMQIKRTFRVAFITFFALGIICSVIMFLFPTELAAMMDDVEAAQSIWALSPAVFLVCLTSTYRGYAQGHSDMTPTTVSQVLEVLAKVVTGLTLAWIFTRMGKSLPVRSAGAIAGVSVGGLAALIYMIFQKRQADKVYNTPVAEPDVPESSGRIFANLIKIGVPITLGSSVMSLITLVDSKLVLNRLQTAAGFNYSQAKILYGVYSKAMTLYNLPAAFITPLTISIVPAIAAAVAEKKHREAGEIAESSMRIAALIALPMGVGISVLSYPLMNVLYPGSNEAGPTLLCYMGISSFFVCMSLMTNAILQAYGNERFPVYSMIVGGLVKIGVNYVLVGRPDINVTGAPIGTICCYAVMCVMNFIFLRKSMEYKPGLKNILLRPVISSAAMGIAAWGLYTIANSVLGGGGLRMAVSMFAGIGVGVVVYLVMIIKVRAITSDDMSLIPKGDKIAKLLHIR